MDEKEKLTLEKISFVEDINRDLYDFRKADHSAYKAKSGLTEEVVRDISKRKHDPQWMLDFRLKSLEIYNQLDLPTWGPDISSLDMDHIVTYVQPDAKMVGNWKDVPDDIKDTFDRLGIPEAEQKSLGGVGAQYDSEVVYHSLQEDMAKQGVIYTDMETAIRDYEDIVREYFMKLVPPKDHKFAALHGAVWSGGSFVYVPAGVEVKMPLQSYFRLNAAGAGQFEHTLIIVEPGASLHFIEGCSAPKYNVTNLHAGCVELYVKEGARLRYSTIENWSRNMMNLNTKRALVEKDGIIEWVSGSFGSHVSCLYPCSILHGENARCEFTGVTFASKGQDLDTGASVICAAPHTSANINTRTISKAGGKGTYRSAVKVTKHAPFAKVSVNCESLMLDHESRSDTLPVMDVEGDSAEVAHEAKVGRISDAAVFYLTSRGIPEEEARAMIVRGFVEPIAKELPLEYAVEMNNLVNIELEGSVG
jgi:Fe-S cluster assembly protein SufB